jgi:hypothetical protein
VDLVARADVLPRPNKMAERATRSEFLLLSSSSSSSSSSLEQVPVEQPKEELSSPIDKGVGGESACQFLFRFRRCCYLAVGDEWCDEFSKSLSISLVNDAVSINHKLSLKENQDSVNCLHLLKSRFCQELHTRLL